jgi:ERCC4-type nuclease
VTIQIDTREHKFELARVQRQIEKKGVKTINSKLYVGDYQSLDNPRLVIDRKKDLQELCSNVCQQHERFRRELVRAQDAGINLIILVEHGGDIHELEDVFFWDNPRLKESPKATTGRALYRSLLTIRDRYGVRFEFCDKRHTGERIVELLSNGTEK